MTLRHEPDRFGYFMLQVRASLEQDGIRVLLEDLGTGEKRAFDSVSDLGEHLEHWSHRDPDDAEPVPL